MNLSYSVYSSDVFQKQGIFNELFQIYLIIPGFSFTQQRQFLFPLKIFEGRKPRFWSK
ncbi:hypothetical protein HMPREF3038_01303 [Akkermansia sp. KLE1797]|nr:hypothetical protein HMPREF3038_01303 [Akkermansia sp. KLE1797]KXU52787.1 hypothetical protein HMPREF3039_02952 [Akkermansia sp. KLE1798]KZA04250.1 hypothetical protein HMPREF1326_02174 [Akkermansia sp. KLE1605]